MFNRKTEVKYEKERTNKRRPREDQEKKKMMN